MYGEQTNPIPYIAAAYGIAFLLMVTYGYFLVLQRKKLLFFAKSLEAVDEKQQQGS
jgi:hypothetical protein